MSASSKIRINCNDRLNEVIVEIEPLRSCAQTINDFTYIFMYIINIENAKYMRKARKQFIYYNKKIFRQKIYDSIDAINALECLEYIPFSILEYSIATNAPQYQDF